MENEAVLGHDGVAIPQAMYLYNAPITDNCKRSGVLNYILFPRLPYTENICNRFPRRGKYSQVALSNIPVLCTRLFLGLCFSVHSKMT